MKISREVKTAVLVILGIVFFIYGFNYLKGEDIFTNEDMYYTQFDYNALSKSSPVTLNGNTVGKVENIELDFKTKKTKITFSINPELKFSKNSIIRLYETGIMGGNALALIEANDNETAKSGDFITSEIEPGLVASLQKNFSGLSTNLDKTLRSADTLLISLNSLVTDNSKDGLKYTIAELNNTLHSFKNLSNSIQNVVSKNDEKLSEILDNFNTTSENLAGMSSDLKQIEFNKTVENLDNTLTSLNKILSGVESGEGSLGKLLNDEALYNNLKGATGEMESLLRDIKLHPKRYFRILSKKEIPYKEE